MLLKYLMFELYMHLKSHFHKRRREGNKDEEKYQGEAILISDYGSI